ncbi:hypothetical protein FAK_10040 [Desulfoferula mesophila]|uniref:Transmembrane protein n=2 Tax=Desulfoferula mesophila TaxID=3058419 RepID=A0AAU9EA00_9BACT|nr:hypothetical protein FAK_10040 [Desulfoferula mesophilus]
MRYAGILTAVLALLLALPLRGDGHSAGNRVVMSSHKSTIDISLSYDGDRIVFFGLNPDPEAQLVVKLVSQVKPEVLLSVKDRFGPVWMAKRQYKVVGAPLMYKVISAVPLDKLMSPQQAEKLGLGYAALMDKVQIQLVRGEKVPGEEQKVRQALISLKEAQGLYHIYIRPDRLRTIERQLYMHHFSFPPTATEGVYVAETYALHNGRVVGYGRHQVTIQKVGLQAWLTQEARQEPLFYGIGAVLASCLAGLGVGLIFKRGGSH